MIFLVFILINCQNSSDVKKIETELNKFCSSNDKSLSITINEFDYVYHFHNGDFFMVTASNHPKVPISDIERANLYLRDSQNDDSNDHGSMHLIFFKGEEFDGAINVDQLKCNISGYYGNKVYFKKDEIKFVRL